MALADEIMADSPRGFWKMNETSGTVMNDSSGLGRHGTYDLSVVQLASEIGPCGTGHRAVRFAAPSNRTTALATVPHNDDWKLGTGSFTIEFWMRRIAQTWDFPGIVSWGVEPDNPSGWMVFAHKPTGAAIFKRSPNNQPGTGSIVEVGYCLTHVVVTHDGTTTRVWKDGVQAAANTVSYAATTETSDLMFGLNREFNNGHIDCALCYFAIYNVALPGSRVLSHYNSGYCADCAKIAWQVGSIRMGVFT